MFTFTPSTTIKSSEINSNFTNLSAHGRWANAKWGVAGSVGTQTLYDYISFPDNATIERVDLLIATAPTGANIIVDIERSQDGGSTWTTIFTGGTNRPQIAAGSRTGNTTTIDVPAVTAYTSLYRAVVSQVGSTVAGSDLSIIMRAKYNLD